MPKTIAAIYENGVLRPLESLQLPEGSILTLEVLAEETATASAETATVQSQNQGLQALIDAGVVTPPPRRKGIQPISKAALRELSQRLGNRPGKPLSEIIIEDRGSL